MFARFSTVAGGAGSVDTPRDVRGFAVKFYTKEGNWDLVGNNIPVFFIQDAIKFPDLVHAVKMEPDRGLPAGGERARHLLGLHLADARESMHMIMWVMSDRAIPRSLRMMEGFGVHSFRLVNAAGESTFVKFHWRPKLGAAVHALGRGGQDRGADPDFHRRDLWEAIESGDFPEWELAVQLFTEEEADELHFDHLDATKLIPEEIVPLRVIGRMVLDRKPDNFFAETEQVAFCPANIVPGIDFSNDPLLQGRLFSYLDTQLIAAGRPELPPDPDQRAQVPVRQPPARRAHADDAAEGPRGVRAELAGRDPRRPAARGGGGRVPSFAAAESGEKGRIRAESFADHYSQARQFYRSQTPPEQAHIASALVFELSKVAHVHIRAGDGRPPAPHRRGPGAAGGRGPGARSRCPRRRRRPRRSSTSIRRRRSS